MASSTGFGKPKAQSKVSKRSAERATAAKQYDQMKSDGLPDYEIYVRIKGKKQWYPVGVVAVKRSSQINRAIFDSQKELLEGAFRIYPSLRKNQQNIEYGYRLKEFKDDPIQVAEPPQAPSINGLQNLVGQVGDRIAGLFKR